MQIPDTPEALFEQLAEPSLREMFPKYDSLSPRNQKMVRLLHTELTKGELTDRTFLEFVGFTLVLWRSFNYSAICANQHLIDSEDEIDTDWVDAATQLARLDQFLCGLLSALDAMPGLEDDTDDPAPSNRYLIRGPGDA